MVWWLLNEVLMNTNIFLCPVPHLEGFKLRMGMGGQQQGKIESRREREGGTYGNLRRQIYHGLSYNSVTKCAPTKRVSGCKRFRLIQVEPIFFTCGCNSANVP
jgi:hypothetical protein